MDAYNSHHVKVFFFLSLLIFDVFFCLLYLVSHCKKQRNNNALIEFYIVQVVHVYNKQNVQGHKLRCDAIQ